MQIHREGPLHLTYCTNIHAADGWDAVFRNLRRFAPSLKARLSPSAPFGIGLRLSARDARELRAGSRLDGFRTFLDDEGLYVAIINGFPYGPFHGTPVKADVYAPDWREAARVDYTLGLAAILRRLLPPQLDGGISTAPFSYKAWMPEPSVSDWRTIASNVARVAVTLGRLRREHGLLVHLDVEPEPDCLIETSEELIGFFERWLLPIGVPAVVSDLGCGESEAQDVLREHVRICLDCCHFAVEYEDADHALARLKAAGIKVGRVQLSSALRVVVPDEAGAAARAADRLRAFADSTYLHQVVERRGGRLRRFPDLPEALAERPQPGVEWRVHFHVPLFACEYDGLGSTQDYVRSMLKLARQRRFTTHLEIETYTWDVLPPGLKIDLLDSIHREYEWVLGVLGATEEASG